MNSVEPNQSGLSIPPEIVRALYTCGLELEPGRCATFALTASGGQSVTVLVRSAAEGLVAIACDNEPVARWLRSLVGFQVEVLEPGLS